MSGRTAHRSRSICPEQKRMLAIETVKILTAGKAMGNYSFENRIPMMKSATIRSVFVPIIVAVLGQLPALGFEPESSVPAEVKVAAVQMLGYDKTDMPRPGFDPSEAVVRYVERAAKDGAQLVVFPEYLLGRISVPGSPDGADLQSSGGGKDLRRSSAAGRSSTTGRLPTHALLFDRAGKIVGKYNKVHAAVDQFEGQPPWSKPPQGKDADWFMKNDPEWKMKRGDGLPRLRLGFRPDRHPHLLRRLVPGDLSHPLPQGGRVARLDQRPQRDGGGLHRQVGDVPERGGDGHHEPSLRCRNDDRPVACTDPCLLPGTQGELHHRHDQSWSRCGRRGRTAATSSSEGPSFTARS